MYSKVAFLAPFELTNCYLSENGKRGRLESIGGINVKLSCHSICLHGDNPAAVAMAQTVREMLEAAWISIKTTQESCISLRKQGGKGKWHHDEDAHKAHCVHEADY